jgi:hypothetical protein
MITQSQQKLLDKWPSLGNPTYQLANHSPALMPMRRVRVVRDGWYGANRKPVVVDQVLDLPADDAAGVVARGLAELLS